jgi:hypothetical protein
MSMAEVVVPIACLRHRSSPASFRLSVNLTQEVVVGEPVQLQVSVAADGKVSSPIRLGADTPDVEPIMIPGATSNPETYMLRYVATAPGRQHVAIRAWLGENIVSEVPFDFEVSPAPASEDEAKIKLKKLWGND